MFATYSTFTNIETSTNENMYCAIGKAICGWVQSSIYLNHIGGKMGSYRDRIDCGRS